MTASYKSSLSTCLIVFCCAVGGSGQAPPDIQAKLSEEIKQLQSLSTDPEIVNGVKSHNATPASPDALAMTNEKWHSLSVLDPFVRAVAFFRFRSI